MKLLGYIGLILILALTLVPGMTKADG